jgi:hypothetical protein
MTTLPPLTNYDASGHRWSADRTIRVTPEYGRGVLSRVPRKGGARPTRYEIHDTLTGAVRYGQTTEHARVQVAGLLAARQRLEWQEWETFGDAWRCFTLDGMIEVRVGKTQDVNHSGLYGVGILGCGPARSWLSNIKHPDARRASTRAVAEHLHHQEQER